MKITRIEATIVRMKAHRVIKDAIHTFDDPAGVVTRVYTDEGITGWAYSYFGISRGAVEVLKATIELELQPFILGEDPFLPKRIRQVLWRGTEYHGVTGITHFGIAAIDMAVWDIVCKALGQPGWRVLGGYRDRIPAYAMVGWYYDDLAEYETALTGAVEEGFRAIKLKVGMGSLEDDLARIRFARSLLGDKITLMIDGNQVFTEQEALRRGRAYQDLGLAWFEEPLPPHQKDALGRLAHQLDIPIATGENDYTKYAYLDLLKKGAVDIIQPDNRRSGGPTEWMEIAALADAYDVKIASHGGGAANVNMLCAMPNAIYLESGSLKSDSMHMEPLRMVDGEILAPEQPGMGTEIRSDWLERHGAI